MIRYIVILVLTLLAATASITAQESASNIERLLQATVYIMQVQDRGDEFFITCVGSGTLVSRDGLILTNAHNTVASPNCPGETIIIALSTRLDEAPSPSFRAEIVQSIDGLDLALLRITRGIDGRLVEPGTLALPFVELADSASLELDNTITIVGYPGIGDDPVAAIRSTVANFTIERGSNISWIKVSTSVSGIMSGGGAYNREGQLIGIPTTAPIVDPNDDNSCFAIQDTNNDGLVNDNDVCIPIGRSLNTLRPSNFARPLLRAASLGLDIEMLTAPQFQIASQDNPQFRRLFFSPAVNGAGMPSTIVSSLPAGSNSVFLFFDYENMQPETIYELRVTTDGIPNQTFSLPPVRWSGGSRGLWYIGSTQQAWPNGVHEFTLLINGEIAGSQRLVIGRASEAAANFNDIVFGLRDLRGNVLGNGFVLPAGNVASARFIYRNMDNGTEWTAIWYFEGAEVRRDTNIWSDGANGSKTISVQDPEGLIPGAYRLELYIAEQLSSTADFTIAGAQQGAFPQIFSALRFATAETAIEALTASPGRSFTGEVTTLFVLFDWEQIGPSSLWTLRLAIDDEMFFDQTIPWSLDQSGQNFLIAIDNRAGIPDGTYRIDLLMNNVQLASEEAQVGIGQLPIDRFAEASGLQLRGQILDAETGEGIAGVTFVLLGEQFSVEDFVWDQSQIFAQGTTDRNGRFQIDRPLELNLPYSVIIETDGYLPITADGVIFTEDTQNPLALTIYLSQD